MEHCLILNSEKYEGKYVATKDAVSREVISSSVNPVDAYNEAVRKGVLSPVLLYIPQHDESSFVF